MADERSEKGKIMRRHKATCSVLERPGDSQPCEGAELLPWADPYIARLLDKHRLEAALHDSLDFLRRDERHERMPLGESEGQNIQSD